MLHDFVTAFRNWIDGMVYVGAGVAVLSLNQTALIVTILAGLASLILASIRIYDRLKYGRGNAE